VRGQGSGVRGRRTRGLSSPDPYPRTPNPWTDGDSQAVDKPTNPTAPPKQQRKERPPVYLAGKRAYQGTGRRKTAVARVFLTEGTGQITINDRPLDAFFTEAKDRNAVVGPLVVIDMRGRIDVTIRVQGGGITGQAGACSQGVARAVKVMF